MSSLSNLALGMCHRSLLFARNPQWTFSAAVNTTWQGFIGMLLAANTPLGTFLSQVSAGTNDGLLHSAPPWAKFWFVSFFLLLSVDFAYIWAANLQWIFF